VQVPDAAFEALSEREREVAELLVDGYSNVNIAAICGLSPNTVRTFMRRLYAKLRVFNRTDLVRTLMRTQARLPTSERFAVHSAER
jgi:DNA-binding CsgD family transcriptional regulator